MVGYQHGYTYHSNDVDCVFFILEYVTVESGRNGSAYRYRLAYEGQGKDGSQFMLGLKSVEQIKADYERRNK